MLDTRIAPLLIRGEYYLRVRRRFEVVLLLSEFSAQFFVVVNLAVENDPELSVVAHHRLMAAWRQVKDRETAKPKSQIETIGLEAIEMRQAEPVVRIKSRTRQRTAGTCVDQQITFIVRSAVPDRAGRAV